MLFLGVNWMSELQVYPPKGVMQWWGGEWWEEELGDWSMSWLSTHWHRGCDVWSLWGWGCYVSGCIIGGLADGCHRLNQKWSVSILTPGLLGGGHLPPKDSSITQNRFVSSIKLIPVRPQASPGHVLSLKSLPNLLIPALAVVHAKEKIQFFQTETFQWNPALDPLTALSKHYCPCPPHLDWAAIASLKHCVLIVLLSCFLSNQMMQFNLFLWEMLSILALFHTRLLCFFSVRWHSLWYSYVWSVFIPTFHQSTFGWSESTNSYTRQCRI